jgi:hypothetical protein
MSADHRIRSEEPSIAELHHHQLDHDRRRGEEQEQPMNTPMHIVELRGENFKRVRAIRLQLHGAQLVEIAGRNAQGKTSVLDLIWAILGGKKASPSKPVREGAARAEGFIDLGELKVTRKWTDGAYGGSDSSTLYVETADGVPVKSPQEVLNKLVGLLCFDPLEFTRQDPPAQARTLRQLAGLDFTAIDKERTEAYERRTAVNREATKLEGQLAGLPIVNAPDDEVALADLLNRHAEAMATKRTNDETRRAAQDVERKADAAREAVADLKIKLKKAEADLEMYEKRQEQLEEKVFELRDPDTDAIAAEMKKIDETNALVRKKRERRAVEASLKAKADERAKLERVLDDCDERKRTALNDAKFPILGLSVDGERVTFNDQPLDQASTAEKIRVSLAIGAALNPKLRVLLVREGSALDADSLAEVDRWATANAMQVWLERVGDAATATGVIIEDGEIKEAA